MSCNPVRYSIYPVFKGALTELYHTGASLKELGKKWFAFSRMDIDVGKMLQNFGH
jgi:hypothetical protein